MKTVVKIDPEKEYENVKKFLGNVSKEHIIQSIEELPSINSSVDNLITVTRVLMEREERRRGIKKEPPKEAKPKGRKAGESPEKKYKKLPSEKFPDLEIIEQTITPEETPLCPCCNKKMKPSGLFDINEKLEAIPKQYYITRTKRTKFNCGGCYGALINTPALPSIIPTSNYGDSFIIDVALSKFCDLLPIERYVQMAFRNGIEGLPAQSLIGLTHQLANFLNPLYLKIKDEVLSSTILQADETPHKMLEGDKSKNWYLWGFFCKKSCFLQIHNTRSGDIAFDILKYSKAEYLVSDSYAGYAKAIKEIKIKFNRKIKEVNCNAHAFRYFRDAGITWKEECKPFLHLYGKIYALEKERKKKEESLSPESKLNIRKSMIPLFEEIKEDCEKKVIDAMPESSFKKSLNYFLNHYDKLTLCTTNINIPLDNNLAERELRSPVVGRKTWYGTHSKRGAKTTAVIFTIVQSCKMNNINPRSYFPWIAKCILENKEPPTPCEYAQLIDTG